MRNLFSKHSRILQVIGAMLIVCMVITDASLYNALVSGDHILNDTGSNDNGLSSEYEIIENHVLETALADGEYDGKNSDIESGQSDTYTTNETKRVFNILEIVPSESKGILGYTISGCMPFDNAVEIPGSVKGTYIATEADMKEAYMDALVNKNPGYNEDSKQERFYDAVKELNNQMANEGGIAPYSYVGGEYKGYYKYVGTNKGVFAKADKSASVVAGEIAMWSRFYEDTENKFPNKGTYDYIFVYINEGEGPSSDPNDLNVTNHKRLKYTNNEKFIREYLGESDAKTWRNSHVCSVATRTPKSMTLDDIENADIIFIKDAGSETYYQHAIFLNNKANGRATDYGKSERFVGGVTTNSDNQITGYTMANDIDDFEKVIRIYERVAVRQDVALVVEKIPAFRTTKNIKANIHKLIAMLYYVKVGPNGRYGDGRLFFTDFIKRYTSDPGEEYIGLRNQYDEHKKQDENGKWVADKMYPDYRAVSLRKTENKDDPSYYYMHSHLDGTNADGSKYEIHVGHPLVLNIGDAITGAYFDSKGNLIPEHDTGKITDRTTHRLIRWNSFMFEDAKLDSYEVQYPGFYKEAGKNENGDVTINEKNYWYYAEIPNDHSDLLIKKGTRTRQTDGSYSENIYFIKYENGDKYWDEAVYYYDSAYDSMSNTTDYVYIDEKGNLAIDDKYSSKNGYWFKIDYDGGVDGQYAYRRRLWDGTNYKYTSSNTDYNIAWPWDGDMTGWLMKRKEEVPYDSNLHLWYDYYQFRDDSERYKGLGTDTSENFGAVYKYENECLVQENQMLKTGSDNFIKSVLDKRVLKREKEDTRHVDSKTLKDYYISMNVLNGDGFNKNAVVGKNNKTIYYNEYEVKYDDEGKNTKPIIPLSIRLKSTCPIVSISVVNLSSVPNKEFAKYSFNKYDVADKEKSITGKCTGKPNLELTSSDVDGKSIASTTKNTPIYEFSGKIPVEVVRDSKFYENRNTKLKVVMTVMLKDGKENTDKATTRTVEDTITIVRRDFFMLN